MLPSDDFRSLCSRGGDGSPFRRGCSRYRYSPARVAVPRGQLRRTPPGQRSIHRPGWPGRSGASWSCLPKRSCGGTSRLGVQLGHRVLADLPIHSVGTDIPDLRRLRAPDGRHVLPVQPGEIDATNGHREVPWMASSRRLKLAPFQFQRTTSPSRQEAVVIRPRPPR